MNKSLQHLAVIACCLLLTAGAAAQTITDEWVSKNYTKREVMIPMRDGVRLYTAIYEPVGCDSVSPILFTRTPYSSSPYGPAMNGHIAAEWSRYARERYIFVCQDVRGRWKSEGEFVNIRPFIKNKKKKTDVDDASDVYDTVDWLLKHVKHHNGRVAVIGNSYCGFYALMAALSGHPAIKAVVPEAPVTDWFMGDDFHHNGVYFVGDSFRFNASVNRPRPVPTETQTPGTDFYDNDEYTYFLHEGTIANLSKLLGDSIAFWTDMINHPNYDEWWKARDTRRSCYNVKPAVMVVGGLYDAEDYFGSMQLYQAIHRQSPSTDLQLVIGPWSHGGWNGSDGSYLGHIRFGANASHYYRESIEYPFLQYYLKGKGTPFAANEKVRMFFSGSNVWRSYPAWPIADAPAMTFYLREGNVLSTEAPRESSSFSEYVSDPAHPVPYTDKTQHSRAKEYMTDDQRFAARRPDVLSFTTEPLKEDLTLCGDVDVDLSVALSTTDADFVVKVIDQFPDDFRYNDAVDGKGDGRRYLMNGYQMLVRGDIMRGRYRNSFSKPEAFVPGTTTPVHFTMQSIAHTFKAGHRLVIQVQSSWFPLADRNPQQFVDIYHCSPSDFVKSNIRVYHQVGAESKITISKLRMEK
jgi:putative CocE/NonD family hydrolase